MLPPRCSRPRRKDGWPSAARDRRVTIRLLEGVIYYLMCRVRALTLPALCPDDRVAIQQPHHNEKLRCSMCRRSLAPHGVEVGFAAVCRFSTRVHSTVIDRRRWEEGRVGEELPRQGPFCSPGPKINDWRSRDWAEFTVQGLYVGSWRRSMKGAERMYHTVPQCRRRSVAAVGSWNWIEIILINCWFSEMQLTINTVGKGGIIDL